MKRLVRMMSEGEFAVALGLWLGGTISIALAIICYSHANNDPQGCFAGGAIFFSVIGIASGLIGFCIMFHLVMDEIYTQIINNR